MGKIKRNFKSVGRIILLVIISLIIGLKFYSWNARTLAGNSMPMPFGWGISVVLSGSMEPELSVDDMVFVHKQSDYQVNDIVVYQSGSSLIIHRIQSINNDKIITKGDANNTADKPIEKSAIKGKAVAHIPFVGVLVRFLKTPLGLIIILGAAIILFELPYLRERKKAQENLEKIKEEIRQLKGE